MLIIQKAIDNLKMSNGVQQYFLIFCDDYVEPITSENWDFHKL